MAGYAMAQKPMWMDCATGTDFVTLFPVIEVSNQSQKKKRTPTANKLQILLTHMPTLKFAIHLFLTNTQEKYTYMTSDFSKQKDKKLAITEKATIKWIYLNNITHIECDS